jgi:hypothetical protein
MKAHHLVQMAAIEVIDRIVQTLLGILIGHAGERIIDHSGPVKLLEGVQHSSLAVGGTSDFPDQQSGEPEFSCVSVPVGNTHVSCWEKDGYTLGAFGLVSFMLQEHPMGEDGALVTQGKLGRRGKDG